MEFADAWKRAQGIESAVTEDEARWLWHLARRAPRCVVEVGAWRGRMAVVLSHAVASAGGHLHTIDPFDGSRGIGGTVFRPEVRQALVGNLERLGADGAWTYHHATSEAVAANWRTTGKPMVTMLWIDGDHSLDGAMADWRSWVPLLAPRAVVALHDSQMPGPAAVRALALGKGWRVAHEVGSLTVLAR